MAADAWSSAKMNKMFGCGAGSVLHAASARSAKSQRREVGRGVGRLDVFGLDVFMLGGFLSQSVALFPIRTSDTESGFPSTKYSLVALVSRK